MSLKFLSAPQKRLLQGITSTSSTFYLNNILSWDGENDISASDLGTIHYVCFRNDTGTVVEFMEIDPSTLIAGGPITINKRGLAYNGDLTTESADRKLDWPVNTIVMLGTDVSQIFQWLKEYIDNIAIAGAPDATTSTKGLVKISTAPADPDSPIVVGTNDTRVPSQGENDALVGTSGTPSSSNPFATKDTTDALTTSLTTLKTFTVGALDNALVKSYFNIQLPFILWTGSYQDDTQTTFKNWVRSSTDIGVAPMGSFIDVTGTGADTMYLDFWNSQLLNNATNIIILDFWAKLPASGTGDISMGFAGATTSFDDTYNANNVNRVMFTQKSTGELYATTSNGAVSGVTNTDISAGLTLTNWNNYRIEYDLSNEAKFYVNGTLKATITTNIATNGNSVLLGFGRSNTSLFKVTAPTLSLEMNP